MFVLLPLGGDGIKTGKGGKTASLTQYTENMQKIVVLWVVMFWNYFFFFLN